MFTIADPDNLKKSPKPEADGYKGGPCPSCGEFACGTWRTPAAPVFCRNGHLWQRGSNVLWEATNRLPHPFFGRSDGKIEKQSTPLDNEVLWGY